MPNKMLIDATHPEETRVVVLRGHRVEEFDFESASRKQLRGNIYLAKVTRVEPSLQAAFVDYGGNRHGFLAFSEIHPDYYQIPIADRQALIAEEERAQRAAEAEADHRAGRRNGHRASRRTRDEIKSERIAAEEESGAMAAASEQMVAEAGTAEGLVPDAGAAIDAEPFSPPPTAGEWPTAFPSEMSASERTEQSQLSELPSAGQPDLHGGDEHLPFEPHAGNEHAVPTPAEHDESADHAREPASEQPEHAHGEVPHGNHADAHEDAEHALPEHALPEQGPEQAEHASAEHEDTDLSGNVTEVSGNGGEGEEENVESVGGADAMEEVPERMPRLRRQYKIQEVIKRRQVMLVQVVKEERGTKGAALTTYLSLAGRYSVLMPNTARGGGISRKITSAEDRRRLKEIAQELEVPEGMGVILRTAGAARTKTEVKRDFEYLLRLWETVRDLTLKSTAPMLVYEEGSLVKRSIRDLYNKDIDEILVAGDHAYGEAKDFMRMLMPSHAKNVKPYRDSLPIFTRHGIESQLDAMFTPVVQLRSGGYIVLNQTEALVAIDVNSGRATREHHIEDTALKTNLEAAEEIARQLRLRDLAGLVVIDFIDMDEKRNNRAVERRLKECLRHDRARIQVGHISHFGLLEMSRQRIRSSVLESSTEKCAHCGGTGHIRSVASVVLQLLRSLEEMLLKGATHNLTVRTRTDIALYLLNQKRAHLRALEERFRIAILVSADPSVGGQVTFLIDKNEQVHSLDQAKAIAAQPANLVPIAEEEEEEEEIIEAETEAGEQAGEAEPAEEHEAGESYALEGQDTEERGEEQAAEAGAGRKRRRRRRGRRGGEPREDAAPDQERIEAAPTGAGHDVDEAEEAGVDTAAEEPAALEGDGERRRRRRGRRGGRRNRRDREGEAGETSAPQEEQLEPELVQAVSDFDGARPAHADVAAFAEPPLLSHDRVEAPSRQPEESPAVEAPPTHEASEPVPEPASEPARRRSTVREAAPITLQDETVPPSADEIPPPSAPEPVVTSPEETTERPRRSGWWSRRVLGRE